MIHNDNRDIFSLYITKHQIVSEYADIANTSSSEAEEHDETDMSNPEEKREVQIGKEIIKLCKQSKSTDKIEQLANELIQIHRGTHT